MKANELSYLRYKLRLVDDILNGEELTPIDMEYYDSMHERLQTRLNTLHAENEALRKELGRYKMAWNMAENELARVSGEKRK